MVPWPFRISQYYSLFTPYEALLYNVLMHALGYSKKFMKIEVEHGYYGVKTIKIHLYKEDSKC